MYPSCSGGSEECRAVPDGGDEGRGRQEEEEEEEPVRGRMEEEETGDDGCHLRRASVQNEMRRRTRAAMIPRT
eukprot:747419-Hanusia_phi.AAC.6